LALWHSLRQHAKALHHTEARMAPGDYRLRFAAFADECSRGSRNEAAIGHPGIAIVVWTSSTTTAAATTSTKQGSGSRNKSSGNATDSLTYSTATRRLCPFPFERSVTHEVEFAREQAALKIEVPLPFLELGFVERPGRSGISGNVRVHHRLPRRHWIETGEPPVVGRSASLGIG